MDNYFPAEGEIKEGDIYPILYHIYKNSISGMLIVKAKTENIEKRLIIEDQRIVFASANSPGDSLGNYLLREEVIDKETYNKTTEYVSKNKRRFGRALMELGFLDYDQLWRCIQGHLKEIVLSLFKIKSGEYRLLVNYDQQEENIVIAWHILSVLVEGMRRFDAREHLKKRFVRIENLYVRNARLLEQLDLKPYEIHIFNLVKRESRLERILQSSELLEFDTMRILYLFLVLEIVSTEKRAADSSLDREKEEEYAAPLSTFKSFEEALKYYNMKYELIFKALSKEIGPIAMSILSRAVEDIMENLPSCLQKIKLNSDGSVNEELILKTLWYHDFDKNIAEFLKGLEEILYAEIYTVKKHLGEEFEQQILKWMNRIEN